MIIDNEYWLLINYCLFIVNSVWLLPCKCGLWVQFHIQTYWGFTKHGRIQQSEDCYVVMSSWAMEFPSSVRHGWWRFHHNFSQPHISIYRGSFFVTLTYQRRVQMWMSWCLKKWNHISSQSWSWPPSLGCPMLVQEPFPFDVGSIYSIWGLLADIFGISSSVTQTCFLQRAKLLGFWLQA